MSGAASTSDNLKSLYQSALQSMGDMTSEMAANFDTLTTKSSDHIEVALFDAYHRTMCSKADRKSKIEDALREVAGRKIRIDFVVSKNASKPTAVAPTLTRAQQIRELNDNEFVKEAITTFDGQIADYFDSRQVRRS